LEANNIAEDNLEIISLNLTDAEQAAIISFLHTLTDDQFLNDPKFGDPYR
jgi:cytochrome c peroxidase